MCTGSHAFIPAENTAKVRLVFQAPGGQANNVLYFQNATGWDAAGLADLVDAVGAAWEDNIRSSVSSAVTLYKVEAQDMSEEEGATNELFVLAAGLNGANVLPSNVTLAVSFRTGFSGRSRRGRLYHVGLEESQVQGDTVPSVVQTGLQAAYAAMFADIAAAVPGTDHVVVSYCADGAWRTSALVTPVTQYLIENTVDSMRRRLLHRGS